MSLRDQLARLRRQFARRTDGRTTNAPEASSRRCLFEQLEKREMLAADPLRVGVLYTETDDRTDLQPDTFELSFVGGAAEL